MLTLETRGLTKSFKISAKERKTRKTDAAVIVAADDVSLTLESGKIYGLLGPNGAGKTTTLRMISSLVKPDKGQILFNGTDIYANVQDYRRHVGFLTSELKLDDFFTPDYTFTYMAKLYGLNDKDISEKKAFLFEKFGITRFKDVKIHDLSTGMKQKTSLAISLCHDPDIIVFDEPTNGLDIIASKDVEDFLTELKTQGKIILISTHIFSLVEKLCDEVGILINGKLVIQGNLKDITATKNLEQLFFELYDDGGSR
jgi:sodium transport system ATP-binding protein